MLNGMGLFSQTIIRAINPETYTFYCVYSEEEVSDWNIAESKHIITCSNLSCVYYRQILGNKASE